MLGVDLVIPDITYLLEHREKLRAIFITHGHEDHIGALPYVLARVQRARLLRTRSRDGLIRVKLKEHRLLDETDLRDVVEPGELVQAGAFTVEFFRSPTASPTPCGLIIQTPLGRSCTPATSSSTTRR